MLLAEQLVGEARERRKHSMSSREFTVSLASAGAFAAVALAIALLLPSARGADAALTVALLIGYALVSRVRFEFSNWYVAPEQLVFIPLLFLAPLPLVPLLVAFAGVLATLPDVVRGDWARDRWLGAFADSWFCVGPVLVLAASGGGGREELVRFER